MSSWSSERGCRPFPFSEIKKATDSFSGAKYLGRGGEGMVFKGVLNDGSHVAVKRLNPDLKQDDYEKEINMLSKLYHTNLVSLRGYCQKSDQKILVYEFMSNGSLADNLYRKPGSFLSWEQRLNISIGAARGLEYLHTGTSYAYKIIHRDVKPDNILLGFNWEAKVSDFGLSKRGPANQAHSSVSTAHARGTIGYYAPEYFSSGKITWRVDVFAFGVVLFELLCKKRPWGRDDSTLNEGGYKDDTTLAKWAERNVDPDLKGVISRSCLEAFIEIAEKCVNREMEQRPSMNEVVAELNYALKLQKRDSENVKSANSEKHSTSGNSHSANGERRQVDSVGTKPPGGSEKRSLQHADFKRSKSAKFEKNSQAEINKSVEQESTIASTKVAHSTKASSEEMKPRKETRANSSGAAIKSGFRDCKSSSSTSEDGKILEIFSSGSEAAKEKDSTKSDSKGTSTSMADIPGTEDKVVLYWSCTGVVADYMKTQFYLKRFSVDIDERDPTENREYELELSRFLAKNQKEFSLPQLFIGGKYIGGAKEVDRLYYSGELGTFLEVYQH